MIYNTPDTRRIISWSNFVTSWSPHMSNCKYPNTRLSCYLRPHSQPLAGMMDSGMHLAWFREVDEDRCQTEGRATGLLIAHGNLLLQDQPEIETLTLGRLSSPLIVGFWDVAVCGRVVWQLLPTLPNSSGSPSKKKMRATFQKIYLISGATIRQHALQGWVSIFQTSCASD